LEPLLRRVAMMKKILLLAGSVLLLVVFSSVASAQTIVRLGHVWPTTYPTAEGVALAAKIIAEKSKGQMELQVFPNAQLGSEQKIMEAVVYGNVDMVICAMGMPGNFFHPFNIGDIPYTFRDNEHIVRFWESGIAKPMFEDFRKQWHVRAIGMMSWGAQNMIAQKPIRSPDDLKGLKIRVPQINIMMETVKAMGASPTVIQVGETFLALQMGTVDGAQSTLPLFRDYKWYEVEKNISLTRHLVTPMPILINEAKWQSLTKQEQELLAEAFKEGSGYSLKELDKLEAKLIEFFKETGLNVITPDIEAFKKVTAGVGVKFRPMWQEYGQDLWERIRDLK
jgi:tripartite ATP-independent transporter DctP family solute receptor